MRLLVYTTILLLSALTAGAQRFVKAVNTIAGLVALNVNDVHTNVTVVNYSTANDGGGGEFTYDANSSATTNWGTVFKPTSYSGRWLRKYDGWLNARWFGAKGNGTTDDAASFQRAFDGANGYPIFVPDGTYRINSMITNVTTASVAYSPGLKLIGAGSEKTIFDTRVASNPMLKIDTTAVANPYFQRDILLKGFQITGAIGTPANADGIFLRHAYDVRLEDVRILTLTRTGIHIDVTEGDNDGSNNLLFSNVRINGCGTWGINVDCDSGLNEVSFLRLENVFIATCGTSSATVPPTSGGMRWKGQVLTARDTAFAENLNVGFFCYGAAGLANTVDFSSITFENNTRRHVYIDGLDSGLFRDCQLKSSAAFVITNAVYLDGGTFSLRNIRFENTFVNIAAANDPCIAFIVTGGNALYNRIENTTWMTFDAGTQTRFSTSENDSIVHIVDNGVDRARDVSRTLRALANTQVAPPAGRGIEIFHGGTIGNIIAYNRTGGSYDALALDGSSVSLKQDGVNRYQITGGNNRFIYAQEWLSPTVQSVAAGDAIAKTSSRQRVVGNGGPVTVTATPTVANGSGDGQILVVQGTDNTNTVTLQDEGTLPGSNIELTTNTIALGQGDSVTLVYDSTDLVWYEIARSLIP